MIGPIMRSLFLKVFVLYWLANIVVFASAFAVIRWMDVGGKRSHEGPFAALDRAVAQEAVDRFTEAGPDGLAAYVGDLSRTSGMDLFVFAVEDREVTGRSIPEGVAGRPSDQRTLVTGRDGQVYSVVVMPPRPPFWRLALPFAVLAIAIGAVSYWLAHHVVAPVQRLRAVSQQLGQGHLTARVGPAVGNRRDAIGDLGRDFDLMADRLHTLVESHQRLLRDVSHELRSPLARLHVALGLAEKKAGPGAADALREIECEASRLNDLIARLLMVSRLEAHPAGLDRVTMDLADLVCHVAEDADYEAQGRHCRTRVVACVPGVLTADPELLHSAIENVVRNALRYTAEGTEVEIALRRLDNCAVITVRDHGPGVPEDALQDIFRPFHRLGDARERESGGAGLGLAITERALRAHGGTARAFNAPDGGLVVELCLPLGSA